MFVNFLSHRCKKASEYKKVLQQLQSHLKQLKNKKQSVSRILRDDITQLNDQAPALVVRTKELLIVETSISVYDLMLQFIDVILIRFDHSIKKQRFGKELLDDDKINEAVFSLVFASSRCGEGLQPVLHSMREIFVQRYGQLYVSTALELPLGNFVNHKIKEKLSKGSGLETRLTEEYEYMIHMKSKNM